MSIRPFLLVSGLALLCAALWYDLAAVTSYRHERASALQAEATSEQLASELQALSDPQASPPARNAANLVALARAALAGGHGAKPEQEATGVPIGFRLILSRDPALRAKYMAAYETSIDAKFGLEFRRLGLNPQDEAQVRSILVDIEAQRLKLAEMAADQGVTQNDPSLKPVKQELLQNDVASLKQLLSADQLHSLDQFSSEGSLIDRIQEFSGNAEAHEVTSEQAAALLPILENASQRDPDGDVISHTINVKAATSAAAAVLSPEQLGVFNAILRKDEAERKLDKASAGK